MVCHAPCRWVIYFPFYLSLQSHSTQTFFSFVKGSLDASGVKGLDQGATHQHQHQETYHTGSWTRGLPTDIGSNSCQSIRPCDATMVAIPVPNGYARVSCLMGLDGELFGSFGTICECQLVYQRFRTKKPATHVKPSRTQSRPHPWMAHRLDPLRFSKCIGKSKRHTHIMRSAHQAFMIHKHHHHALRSSWGGNLVMLRQERIELPTLGLWDLRAANWATAAWAKFWFGTPEFVKLILQTRAARMKTECLNQLDYELQTCRHVMNRCIWQWFSIRFNNANAPWRSCQKFQPSLICPQLSCVSPACLCHIVLHN